MSKTSTSTERSCCLNNENFLEVNGFFVCTSCGVCRNEIVFNTMNFSDYDVHPDEFSGVMYDEINDICENGDIPKRTRHIAQRLFAKYRQMTPKLNLKILAATVIYIACKRDGNPRSLREISAISGSCYKKIGKYDAIINSKHVSIEPNMYINRFCCKLGKNFDFLKKVKLKLQEISLNCKVTPITQASFVIYLVCLDENSVDKRLTQNLSNISGVSTSTLTRLAKLVKLTPPPQHN